MTARERLGDIVLKAAVLVGVIAVWWFLTNRSTSPYYPSPGDVLPTVWNDWLTDTAAWTDSIIPSVVRIAYGFFLAAVASIALGMAIGRSRWLSELLEPSIHFLRAIPPPALLGVSLVVFGIGDVQKVALIAFGVAPPILLNTIDGARSVEELQLETAQAYQISRWDRIVRVIFPAAAPKVFAGLRVSISLAVILMVISELVAAPDGVGSRINGAARDFDYVDLWAGLVVLALLGIVLNALLTVVERSALRWRQP